MSRKSRPLPTLRQVLAGVHFRVTLFAVAMAGITVLLTGVATIVATSRNNLQLVAQSASYTVAPAVIFGDRHAAREGLIPFARDGVAAIRVTSNDGHLLASWQRPASPHFSIARPIAALFFAAPITAPVKLGDRVVGQVAVSGDARDIAGYIGSGAAGALACLIITAIAARLLAQRLQSSVIEPLAAIAEVAHAVSADRAFERRAPPSTIAEIDALSGDFNSLLAELDDWHRQLRRENEQLSHSAAHDALTGLPNRAHFEQRLAGMLVQAGASNQSFALLYLDGNEFKAINDRYGHRAGDAVLVEVAERLRQCLRAGDLAARLGGDEFGLLLAAPLALQPEVAQQQHRHDEGDQRVSHVQPHLAHPLQRAGQLQPVGHQGAEQGQGHHDGTAEPAGHHRPMPGEPGPQATQQRRREQHDPLHEERDQRQADPVELQGEGLGQHQYQHQQLGQHHQDEQGLRFA